MLIKCSVYVELQNDEHICVSVAIEGEDKELELVRSTGKPHTYVGEWTVSTSENQSLDYIYIVYRNNVRVEMGTSKTIELPSDKRVHGIMDLLDRSKMESYWPSPRAVELRFGAQQLHVTGLRNQGYRGQEPTIHSDFDIDPLLIHELKECCVRIYNRKYPEHTAELALECQHQSLSFVKALPCCRIPIQSLDEENCIVMDIVETETQVLWARAHLRNAQLSMILGQANLNIIRPDLTCVGTISLSYLVLLPFIHPKNINTTIMSLPTQSPALIYVGHRGAGGCGTGSRFTENTLSSFQKAAAQGVGWIEFDIYLTKDLVPVIFHDQLLRLATAHDSHKFSYRRWSELRLPINMFTLAELQTLELKSHIREEKVVAMCSELMRHSRIHAENGTAETWSLPERITTLQDTLTQMPIESVFLIEIKYPTDRAIQDSPERFYPDRNTVVEKILSTVFSAPTSDRSIVFGSFDPDICTLLAFKQTRYPVLFITWFPTDGSSDEAINTLDPRCMTPEGAIAFAAHLSLPGIVCEAKWVLENSARYLDVIKRTGLSVFTYGMDNCVLDRVKLQHQLGVHGVISDKIHRVNLI